ncbi:MAG: hypothetical protein WCS65_10410 [Verrucomicrobiae bacterium]
MDELVRIRSALGIAIAEISKGFHSVEGVDIQQFPNVVRCPELDALIPEPARPTPAVHHAEKCAVILAVDGQPPVGERVTDTEILDQCVSSASCPSAVKISAKNVLVKEPRGKARGIWRDPALSGPLLSTDDRHGGRPSSTKAAASFGVSDPKGMNTAAGIGRKNRRLDCPPASPDK